MGLRLNRRVPGRGWPRTTGPAGRQSAIYMPCQTWWSGRGERRARALFRFRALVEIERGGSVGGVSSACCVCVARVSTALDGTSHGAGKRAQSRQIPVVAVEGGRFRPAAELPCNSHYYRLNHLHATSGVIYISAEYIAQIIYISINCIHITFRVAWAIQNVMWMQLRKWRLVILFRAFSSG